MHNKVFRAWSLFVAVFITSPIFSQGMKIVEKDDKEPRIVRLTLQSAVLEKNMNCTVVFPETYVPDAKDQPMLLLLHGRGRNERTLLENAGTRKNLLQAPFVIVMPQGDRSWWIDSPVRPAEKYGRYLVELLDFVSGEYGLSRRPERCAVTGWSMGGYGAMRFIQNHRDRFGCVATIIALLDYPRPVEDFPAKQSMAIEPQELGTDPKKWESLNPINDAEKLRGKSILFITGRDAFDRTMNERFHDRLEELRIPHRWESRNGGHTFSLVAESLPTVLRFVEDFFTKTD